MDMNLSTLWRIVNRGTWCARVHRVAKSQILLSDWTTAICHKSKLVIKDLSMKVRGKQNLFSKCFMLWICSLHSVLSDSLWLHEPQHTRPPCASPTPGIYPNSCPLSQWCHPSISSSVVPFSSCLQFFPASGSFQMSHFFALGGQTIGVSASTCYSSVQMWRLVHLIK